MMSTNPPATSSAPIVASSPAPSVPVFGKDWTGTIVVGGTVVVVLVVVGPNGN